jgi:hypothetical protein
MITMRDLTGKSDWDVSTGGEELLRTYDVYVLVLTITIEHSGPIKSSLRVAKEGSEQN